VVLAVSGATWASSVGGFIADSNQFGYAGTVQNLSTPGSSAVAVPGNQDASLYLVNNAPVSSNSTLNGYAANNNSNDIESNWYQSPGANQNYGFFQINDGGTMTSATGGWTQQSNGLWNFAVTVTGANASYANSFARLWQPDAGDAWSGTYTSYTYTLTATGMTTSVADGWRYNTADPATITGSFAGTFVSDPRDPASAYDGDTYSVNLDFSNTLWGSTNWSDTYDGVTYGNYSTFAAPVPEPVTIVSAFMVITGLGGYIRKRMKAPVAKA
jgi:hypothetical protein